MDVSYPCEYLRFINDNDLTHHVSSVGPHAVLDSLDPAVRERHAVAAGHHARLAGLLLREVQALVISHRVAVSSK